MNALACSLHQSAKRAQVKQIKRYYVKLQPGVFKIRFPYERDGKTHFFAENGFLRLLVLPFCCFCEDSGTVFRIYCVFVTLSAVLNFDVVFG